MVDIHCHLLPGIDDGPPTESVALALARALVNDGVRHVVATPHVFPGRYENRRAGIEAATAAFTRLLRNEGVRLGLSFAGEVRLDAISLDWLDRGWVPLMGEGPGIACLLLELPDGDIPVGSERFVGRLLSRSITPVIAHPERNRAVMDRPERIRRFTDEGCQLQITAGSVVGQFGRRAARTAAWLLDQGLVHAVASDAHNLGSRRPMMSEARRWLADHLGAAVAHELTEAGPARLCGLPSGTPAAA